VTPTVHRCRDDVVVPAEREACFAVLRDLGTYGRWWTLVRVESLSGGTRLTPGVRFRFGATRQDGSTTSWVARVTEVHAPRRLELEYDEGDLLGTTGWELADVPGGTRVAYVYYGVRPDAPSAAASFARYGTRLHSLAMREDALAGLVRLLGGAGRELDDAAWRARVRERMTSGIAALG
jgi:uncharacterized protein YndB with AHSA1/START domain